MSVIIRVKMAKNLEAEYKKFTCVLCVDTKFKYLQQHLVSEHFANLLPSFNDLKCPQESCSFIGRTEKYVKEHFNRYDFSLTYIFLNYV